MTICPTCSGVGYIEKVVPVFADGGWSDVEEVTVNCECNPDPTDADAPHWAAGEPRGTAWEDFNPPFNDRQYAGL
jgi:hypothetical protein